MVSEVSLKAEFEQYSPMVYCVAFRILKSREDAEDIVQDVFAHKLAKLKASMGEGRPDNLGAMLARVARNHAIDVYRRRRFTSPEEVDFDMEAGSMAGDAVEDAQQNHDRQDALDLALGDLEPHFREVLTLKYLLKQGWEDVADKIGLSVQGARKRAEKAKTEIRKSMNKSEDRGMP